MPASREVLARRLAFQAAGCSALGSPLYGSLLQSAVLDLDAEGSVWRVLEGFEGESGSVIDTAAGAATDDAPVYRLSMEPDPDEPGFEVRLGDELLATCRAHGTGVHWCVG